MTDGLTQASRGSKYLSKKNEIEKLCKEFDEKPSKDLVKKLIGELSELKDMPAGSYKKVMEKSYIEKQISRYQRYLDENQ